MSTLRNIERPLKIKPDSNRKQAAIDQIKHYIRSNRLQAGERLPTVRKLSDHFDVSRDAIWRGLRQLQQEDWLDLLPNKRYMVSEKLYKQVLTSLKVKAIFSGKRYIFFSGFRRLADSLSKECHYHNVDLRIDLLAPKTDPTEAIWEDCDLIMIDSDSSTSFLKTFDHFPVPVIGLDAEYNERYKANIVTDHYLGGRLAAEAMLRRGARKAIIVFHTGSENNPRVAARIDGFRQTWIEGGRTPASLSTESIGWSRSSFEIALKIQDFLTNNPTHDNYFVTDGRLATNFLEVLAYMNVSVPEAVGLIGYDGAQRGALTDPPMTTIQQDMDKIALKAVNWVRAIASGDDRSGVLERIPPLFTERDSY